MWIFHISVFPFHYVVFPPAEHSAQSDLFPAQTPRRVFKLAKQEEKGKPNLISGSI